MDTQCDTDISERQTDPIYEEVNTQCDISERQTDFHSQPIYQDPHTDSEGLKSTPETMKIQEGEPGVDVLRECPQVKKPFLSLWQENCGIGSGHKKKPPNKKDLGQTMCTTSLKRQFHLVLSHLNINISRLPGAGKKTLHIYQ